MNRREYLCVGLATFTSGCVTELSGKRTETSAEVTVGQLEISNSDDTPHEAEIELYAADELVYNETHSVGSVEDRNSDSVVIVERDWPVNVDQYTFRGRFDGREWLRVMFDEPHSKTCHIAKLHISVGGDYDIYTATAGADESLC